MFALECWHSSKVFEINLTWQHNKNDDQKMTYEFLGAEHIFCVFVERSSADSKLLK